MHAVRIHAVCKPACRNQHSEARQGLVVQLKHACFWPPEVICIMHAVHIDAVCKVARL